MTKNDTIDYNLYNIPKEFWRRFKSKTASEGKNMKQVILELIRKYLKDS